MDVLTCRVCLGKNPAISTGRFAGILHLYSENPEVVNNTRGTCDNDDEPSVTRQASRTLPPTTVTLPPYRTIQCAAMSGELFASEEAVSHLARRAGRASYSWGPCIDTPPVDESAMDVAMSSQTELTDADDDRSPTLCERCC